MYYEKKIRRSSIYYPYNTFILHTYPKDIGLEYAHISGIFFHLFTKAYEMLIRRISKLLMAGRPLHLSKEIHSTCFFIWYIISENMSMGSTFASVEYRKHVSIMMIFSSPKKSWLYRCFFLGILSQKRFSNIIQFVLWFVLSLHLNEWDGSKLLPFITVTAITSVSKYPEKGYHCNYEMEKYTYSFLLTDGEFSTYKQKEFRTDVFL